MDLESLQMRNMLLEELGDADISVITAGQDLEQIFESIQTGDVIVVLTVILGILILVLIMLIASWKVFEKAKKPGWEAIIPHHNIIVMMQLTNTPTWWWFLLFIPFVNIIMSVIIVYRLAKAFGYGAGMTIGLIFLPFICLPWLAWGKSVYTAPLEENP